MDSAVKAQWVQALRSGEYRKGRGALHPGYDTYCVLGVLCDLFRQETDRGEWRYDGYNDITFVAETEDGDVDSDTALLPSPVQLWAELPTNGGFAYDPDWVENPAELPFWNDDQDLPFDQLADLIEKHA